LLFRQDGIGCEARSVFRLLPVQSQAAGWIYS